MQHRTRRAVAATAVALAVVIVAVSFGVVSGFSMPSGHGLPATSSDPGATPALSKFTPLVSVTLNINPSQVKEGQSINLQTSVNGGTMPFSYSYSGLPPGCTSLNLSAFACTPSSTGNFGVQVTVIDFHQNSSTSNTQNVDVTSSNSGNGNNGGGGNNSSNPFSGLLSGLGGFLSILLIFGLIGFVTWILLIVGVWIIAIVLVRRLPKRGATSPVTATVKCAACSAAITAGSKFCPECGTSTTPKTP